MADKGGRAQDEPRIYVESEEQPERMLLETRVGRDDGYQKQQGRGERGLHGYALAEVELQIHLSCGLSSPMARTWR